MFSLSDVLVAILPFSELLLFPGSSSPAGGSATVGRDAWGFSNYFDDPYNFQEFPALNSLHPITLAHWSKVLFHRGVNVLEPLANFIKGAMIDGVGLDPYLLRLCTLLMHFCNAFLLSVWLALVTEQQRAALGYSRRTSWTVIAALCALWTVHPLHAEVLGWLSAQNYAFALTFALLSSIHLELAILAATPVPKKDQKNKKKDEEAVAAVVLPSFFLPGIRAEGHLVSTVLLYVCACQCKAPAIALPGAHVLRLLVALRDLPSGKATGAGAGAPVPDLHKKNVKRLDKLYPETLVDVPPVKPLAEAAATASLWSITASYAFYSGLACAVCAHGMLGANADSVSQYPEFTSWAGFMIGLVLRCGLVLKLHVTHALLPLRLMLIYTPPQALAHLYFIPDIFLSSSASSASLWSTFGGAGSLWANPALLEVAEDAVAGVLLVAAVSAAAVVGYLWRGNSMLLLGWGTYLLLWLPALGIVQHGQDVLGADRYNYFPLALGAVPMAWTVLCSIAGGYGNVSTRQGANEPKQNKITALLVGVVLLPVFCFYAAKQNAQLFLWRSDRALLQANLHANPACDMCHVWLSEHYGYHLNDEVNGVLHREQFLNLTLSHDRKGQWTYLPAAGVLIKLNRQQQACELVERAYTLGIADGGPIMQAHTNHAMTTNDQIVCQCMQGITRELAQKSVSALQDILAANEAAAGVHLRPLIQAKLANHVEKLEQWLLDGTSYEASFLW